MNCKPIPKNRFAAIVALFISLLMPTVAKAQEAYAVEEDATLTFYYDDQRANRTGTVYGIDQTHSADNNHPVWAGSEWYVCNDKITKVVFDASFNDYRPSTTENWFYNCRKIAAIEGLDNLNTENVTNMNSMFSGCSALTTLDLLNLNTDNVTDMSNMFYGCNALTKLNLSSFNTEKVSSMAEMFYGCNSLTELDVTSFNTAKVTNMNFMFASCRTLTSLDLSNFNTENVTNMKGMFIGCDALTELDLSNFNTKKVTDIAYMFSACISLKTIYCDNTWSCDFSTYIFSDCTALKGAVAYDESKVDVSMANPKTGYFTYKTYAVEDGTTLTFYHDKLYGTRTGMVYYIGNTNGNTNITKAVFDASFINYAPTSTASWFQDCTKLATIDGLDNLNTEKITDMSEMFSGCKALTTIYCNYAWTCSSSSEMFNGCTSLKGAVPFDSSKNGVSMANPYSGYFTATVEFEAYAVEDGTTLTFYYDLLRDTRSGTVYTAFDEHQWTGTDITKVVFDATFNYYLPTSTASWFKDCSKLAAIEGLDNLNTSNVTDMSNMFNGCSALTELDLLNFNTEKVTNMGNMFSGCSALTTINCSRAWTCNESTDMFKGCTSLIGAVAYDASKTDVIMANPLTGYFTCDIEAYAFEEGATLTFCYDKLYGTRTGTVYNIGSTKGNTNITKAVFDASFKNYAPTSTASWFQNCLKLATIEGIENLNTENVTDMSSMFMWCSALTTLDLSNFNTSNVTNMNSMFSNCNLTTLDLSNFNTENVTNMSSMFSGCSALTTLDLSNFNTEKVTNMSFMFSYCYALTTLDISNFNTKKVTSMRAMFYYCNSLKTIYCDNTWTCGTSTEMFKGCTALKGAVEYDENATDVAMANPETGYFTKGGASSVSEINADSDNRVTGIYNLNGVKMHDDLQSLPAGIYIVNGKKVIVK